MIENNKSDFALKKTIINQQIMIKANAKFRKYAVNDHVTKHFLRIYMNTARRKLIEGIKKLQVEVITLFDLSYKFSIQLKPFPLIGILF